MKRIAPGKPRVLLIHPPIAKGCEPPAGVARLAGALARHGVACRTWDASLEGQLWLMEEGRRIAAGADAEAERPTARGASPNGNPSGGMRCGPLPAAARAAEGGRGGDTWSRRAAVHLDDHLAQIRRQDLYRHPDRYRRAVADLNRLLAVAARPAGVRVTLADYEDRRLSPLCSADLLAAAAAPEQNPFYPWLRDRLGELLAETAATDVGISLNYLSQALCAFSIIGLLRRERPRLRIHLGGGLVTSWMSRPGWRSPFGGLLDTLIAGPGEGPLLARLGIAHKGGPDRPDQDGLPLADYLSPGGILPYSTASGCWWRQCSFCPERAEGSRYRPLAEDEVASDLRALVATARPSLIHLLDNALSPQTLRAFASVPPGAPWYGFARFTPELADAGFCRSLREAGCVMLKLGLESGDPAVLRALCKGINLATASLALRNLKEAGIATYVYLLFGTPAESGRAARQTLAFTVDHAGLIGFLNLAIFNLPAWGEEAARFGDGEFYDGDLSLYRPFAHPQGWGRGEVRRFLEGEFKREPAVAAILRRDPPFFTSNHAPFFALAGALPP